MSGQLTGAARVLDMADRARRCGGMAPHRLYHECVEAFRRGEVEFDQVTPLYRHAAIHAGSVVPKGEVRYFSCPECGAQLDIPGWDN